MVYNLATCGGWTAKVGSYVGSSSCIQGRVGLVLLFFIIAIARKWGGEEIGLEFNFWTGILFGIVPYLLIIFLTGSMKFAMVLGLLGGILGGYLGGAMFGGSDNE